MQAEGDELPAREIARRLPVWAALSDLFLDTRLQPYDHRRVAEAIRRAGHSVAEADAILRDEVAPIFHANLLSAAGEWVSWSEADVRARVLGGLRRGGTGFWRKFRAGRRAGMVRGDWDEVKRLLSLPERRG
jgi:hypothetical protein